jgi:hypothetical protein
VPQEGVAAEPDLLYRRFQGGVQETKKTSKHPIFGSKFEPWYLRKIIRNATHLTSWYPRKRVPTLVMKRESILEYLDNEARVLTNVQLLRLLTDVLL